MMPAAASIPALAKWFWPVVPMLAATVLAIDGTLVSQYVIAAVPTVVTAFLVWRQAKDRHQTDLQTAHIERETATASARIDGTDRLIDHLKSELDRAERRTAATEEARREDRSLIDELQSEVRGLNRRFLALNRRHTSAMVGVAILTAQIQQLGEDPQWSIARISGEIDPDIVSG